MCMFLIIIYLFDIQCKQSRKKESQYFKLAKDKLSLIRLATCDHVKVQACNEFIIKSVKFLLKIFNIAITFEHVHMYI